MRPVLFSSYAFRKKKYAVQAIITPIISTYRIKNGSKYHCECDPNILKTELICAYITDFLKLNFPCNFTDIRLYRRYVDRRDELPLDKMCSIDINELMINSAKRENYVNFNNERFAAAIDNFAVEALRQSFLVEAVRRDDGRVFVLYNTGVFNKKSMKPVDSIDGIMRRMDAVNAYQVIKSLYEKGGIRCVKTVERKNDIIVL